MIEFLDLLLKDIENAAGRVAGFEPVSEWVGENIVLCALFVCLQGITENQLEVGRRASVSSVTVRHKGLRGWETKCDYARWVMGKEKKQHVSGTRRHSISAIMIGAPKIPDNRRKVAWGDMKSRPRAGCSKSWIKNRFHLFRL